jgi:hypothetical protein
MTKTLLRLPALLALFASAIAGTQEAAAQVTKPMNQIVGVCVAPVVYRQGTSDPLADGADRLETLGTKVIKVWYSLDRYKINYPAPNWETVTTLSGLAQTNYYRNLFDRKTFKTFILEVNELNPAKWKNGMTEAEKQSTYTQFYELSLYLIDRYRAEGKTFVLQNWEGDNAISDVKSDPIAVQGMIDWLNARQDGISAARNVRGVSDTVFGAAEVNKVVNSKWTHKIVDTVLPKLRMDLYSYSNWETRGDSQKLISALNYIKSKAPSSAYFGDNNIMMGECGAGEILFSNSTTHARR